MIIGLYITHVITIIIKILKIVRNVLVKIIAHYAKIILLLLMEINRYASKKKN